LTTLTLDIKQYEAPPAPPSTVTEPVTHIDIIHTATAGLKGTTELRSLDYMFRPHSDWFFGPVQGQSKFIATTDIEDAYLAQGWLESDEEKGGPNGETHVLSHVESTESGWTATQIWGFQIVAGERRYCRNIVIAKGAERVEFRLVYDWIS
jgi:hypothetical protein